MFVDDWDRTGQHFIEQHQSIILNHTFYLYEVEFYLGKQN